MLNLLVWCGLIGFVYLVTLTNDDDWSSSKVYKDLNETMLNRNEDV
jgi:hypothetical protein|tara:strand:- start:229 stop:366 length:138 start_codon:yes stop_codon:yes gene_type:complete